MPSPENIDLLVIGGGMAGSMAAAAAAERGLSVVLIRKGYGATALSSGAIDFGREEVADSLAEEAVAFFLRGMNAAGYAYSGRRGDAIALLTTLGSCKTAQLYPVSAASGCLDQIINNKVLFIGIKGLVEYNAAYVARAAQALFRERSGRGQAAFSEIEFPGVRHTHNVLGFDLAQLLDEDAVRQQFVEVVARAAQSYSHVALPPIIGLNQPAAAFAPLVGACDALCFELLSATPSLLGLRLQNALGRWVQQWARIVHGVVGRIKADARIVREVQVVDRDTEHCFKPRHLVLATGKFIGGGLRYGAPGTVGFRETVLGLPVWHKNVLASDKSLVTLSAASFSDQQPFLSVGVRVDTNSRPLDAQGKAAYENVFAVGALTQGCDYRAGRGSLGTALMHGYRVGKWISEQLHA